MVVAVAVLVTASGTVELGITGSGTATGMSVVEDRCFFISLEEIRRCRVPVAVEIVISWSITKDLSSNILP